MVFASTAGLLSVGQLVPSDTSQVAAGETLPQSLLWLLTWVLFILALLLSGSLQTMRLSGKRRVSNLGSSSLDESEGMQRRRVSWFIGYVVFTISWVFLATWHVYGNGNFRFAINAWWQWVAWFATFFLVFRLIQISGTSRPFATWMLVLCFLVSLHGCYQVFISFPADQERFRNDPMGVLADAGIEASPGSSTYLLFEGRLQDASPTGPFALTNSLAAFLLPWLIILFANAFERLLSPQVPRKSANFNVSVSRVGIAAMIVGLLMLWILLLTKSRTAWLALLSGCFISIVSHPRIAMQLKRLLTPVALGIGILSIVAVGFIYQWDRKILLEASQSLSYRIEYWQTTLKMTRDHLWFGVGPGNFQTYYATYKSLDASETVADPHQFLLETLGTAGLPALVGLVVAIAIGTRIGCQGIWQRFKLSSKPSIVAGQTNVGPNRGSPAKLQINQDGTLHVGSRFQDEFSTSIESKRTAMLAVFWGGLAGLLAVWISLGALGPIPVATPYWFGVPIVIGYFGWFWFRELREDKTVDSRDDRTTGVSELGTHKDMRLSGEMRLHGVGAAIVALLIHLLASGGWMTPGVCNSLAILVAILLVDSNRFRDWPASAKPSFSNELRKPMTFDALRSWSAAISAVVPILLLLVFYYSTWLPTQQMKLLQNRILDSTLRMTTQRVEELTAADPWDSFSSRVLADRAYNEAREILSRQRFENGVLDQASLGYQALTNARELATQFRAKNSADWQVWLQSGIWELDVSGVSPGSLPVALTHLREASKRSPSDLGLLVQVCLIAWIAEESVLAKGIWEQVDRLQQRITHVDRKLIAARIYWPVSVGPKSTRLPSTVWQQAREAAGDAISLRPGWVGAEPVFEFLRTQLFKPGELN